MKRSGRYALEDFHLNIYAGEFLFAYGFPDSGIRELGELLKGSITAERGDFYIAEKKVSSHPFSDPGRLGIYIVQSENNLVEDFSVAENLFFGGKKRFFQVCVARKRQEIMAKRLLEQFDLDLDVRRKSIGLGYFDQILLKLIMAYARGAKLVVIDGIIGFVNEEETEKLEKAIRILLEDGIAVLWLNQRMDYARTMADRFLILMKGKNVRTVYKGYDRTLDKLLDIVIKSDAGNRQQTGADEREEVFRIDGLTGKHFSGMSLTIRKGDLLCLCSTESIAMAEWRDIICGENARYSGEMYLENRRYQPASYTECIREGVCFLDMMWFERHGNPDMRIEDNLMLESWWRRKGLHGILGKQQKEYNRAVYRDGHPGWPTDYWRSLTADQQKILLLEKLCLESHKLVIITEPFFQLHNTMLDTFYELIRRILENNGAVLLMTATDYDCRRICSRIISLDDWIR